MLDAGIVAPVPKGDWANNVTYYPLNIVNYNGNSWIAKRENIGQTPAEGQYWMAYGTAVPIATTSVAGIVIPDGLTITVDAQGHISSVFSGDLDDLGDVDITTPSNGQVLKYNAASQKWENGTDTGGLIPHLIIISETGSTVTVTKGAWSTTATETSTGHFECDVPEFGTYTIDAVLGGDDAQVSLVVDAVKIYTVDDSHFHADITVTFPNGSTCSCGKTGETPAYATTSPHTFTVHSSGVYTISATDGVSTATDTVTISTDGQSESVTLSFVPSGSTVVPTDDIQTWLHCGNIWDKAYTTLNEVLADSTTLLALMSYNNAVDYLVRSTTWASDICSDSTAMTDIGANNYCANTLLADSTWVVAICNSSYSSSVLNVHVPTMTSATTPSGVVSSQVAERTGYEAYKIFAGSLSQGYCSNNSISSPIWIRYEFPTAKVINKAVITSGYNASKFHAHTVTIQGSNDASTWDTLGSESIGSYADYNVNIVFANSTAYKYVQMIISSYNYAESTSSNVVFIKGGGGVFYGREDV